MTNVQLLRAAWVVPVEGPSIADGVVAIEGGRIAWVGAWSKRPRQFRDLPESQQQHYDNAALLPGFVNAHSHVVFHYQRGLKDGTPMVDWLQQGVVRLDWSDSARNYAACVAGFREGLRAGFTTWGDNHFLLAPMQAAHETGIRATCFLEIFGVMGELEREAASLQRRLDEAASMSTDKVRAAISPHAVYTVPPALLDRCARFSREQGYLLSMHLAESPEERQFLNSTKGKLRQFIGREGSRRIPPVPGSFTDYLRQHGLLHERTLLIHGVQLEPAELAQIAKHRATLVHCPVSNARLRCGIAPIEAALKVKVPLALGTDGIASGERHDPFETMRLALLLQEALHPDGRCTTAASVFQAATLGGARALHRDQDIGSLVAGKEADMVLLELPQTPMHPSRSIEEEIVYGGERSRVRGVWIAGERVVTS
ncbi:MAG: Aminodeoxyfutalosine deaminase [bacterium]|nr:Aminodeoxyfutalosine deaminase [bacterium]